MAEYWKSAPKFWCKQCKVFIRDTPFEKTQHEASGKHQGNLKRFLRDLHRDNERQQRETQKAKNEVERLRQTVAGGSSSSSSSSTAAATSSIAASIPPWKRAAPKPQERPVSLEERKKQITQLAEMGVAIPEEFRGDMALAGEWKTVSERVIEEEKPKISSSAAAAVGVRKRKLENGEEEEHAPVRFVSKGWGSAVRQYPGSQGDEDLDALLESTKEIKKVKPSVPNAVDTTTKDVVDTPVKTEGDSTAPETDETSRVKKEEEEPSDVATSSVPAVKAESEEAAAPGVVFKKRRPKAMRK